MSFPDGELHPLTSDTNDYEGLSLSKDGKTLSAIQSRLRFELSIADLTDLDHAHPVPLSSQLSIWRWDWFLNGSLLLPQSGAFKVVTPDGKETILTSDTKHISDQVSVCGDGRYVVYREVGRTSAASANLWRIDADGTNEKQLTSGLNEQSPHLLARRQVGLLRRQWRQALGQTHSHQRRLSRNHRPQGCLLFLALT